MTIGFITLVEICLFLIALLLIVIGYLIVFKYKYNLVNQYDPRKHDVKFPIMVGKFELVLGIITIIATTASLFLIEYVMYAILCILPLALITGLIIISKKCN